MKTLQITKYTKPIDVDTSVVILIYIGGKVVDAITHSPEGWGTSCLLCYTDPELENVVDTIAKNIGDRVPEFRCYSATSSELILPSNQNIFIDDVKETDVVQVFHKGTVDQAGTLVYVKDMWSLFIMHKATILAPTLGDLFKPDEALPAHNQITDLYEFKIV